MYNAIRSWKQVPDLFRAYHLLTLNLMPEILHCRELSSLDRKIAVFNTILWQSNLSRATQKTTASMNEMC